MKILIVSDTHCFVDPRIGHLSNDSDLVVHAGDIGEQGVLDLLTPANGTILAVTGNNDSPNLWPASERAEVKALPPIARIELPGGILTVEHGHRHCMHKPAHSDLRRAHPDARLIVYGHTHKQVLDQSDEPWVLNPGAAGRERTNGGPACTLLIIDEDQQWTFELLRFEAFQQTGS